MRTTTAHNHTNVIPRDKDAITGDNGDITSGLQTDGPANIT